MPTPQSSIRDFVDEKLTEIRTKNRHYSLRDLAMRLKVSPSTLSELMAGKRKISRKLAASFLENLHASPEKRLSVLREFEKLELNTPGASEDERPFIQIEIDRYRFISDWYYLPLLSLAETDDFKSDPQWIARRLGISTSEAQSAIELLVRLELLHRTSKGTIKPTGKQFSTSDEVSNVYLRKGHFDNLDLARRSLEIDEIESRDFTSMTLAFDPENMIEAKAMIRNFRNRFCKKVESGQKKEVFRICIQLFQLTRNESLEAESV